MYDFEAINAVKEYCIAHRQTLAIAESVTSGHLQAAISLAENASLFFQGGMTAYNLGQKCRHLEVNPIHAQECNSVSPGIAGDMAQSACKLFLSDWGIGITGYAAPVPEMQIFELFAFYAIAFRGEVIESGKIATSQAQAPASQIDYTNQVILFLQKLMDK